ncbi:mitochondrial ribosomal protein L49 precursor, putative [Babesia microti strain RI]|uniref:Large ribosomal subunit protein mL49 n=1 Tax=Babesia microti (strain RI) TaxID=1133968 RepID=A0A1N6LXF8_BABMR|nr:mitochondrial ribosomal protein L49 precursor, putative [Babesia microti strain RI]SIO73551.1 mitochondrial ribosomal protein L49 precursor, putative [Babesia microti strain RI]|eukprot:XP_021337640.1 mitochondrial ribosomal protein L49 precursor, putative [Babesia microti strain RI]
MPINIHKIPFHIRRTSSDNLAVFLKYKNNKNTVFTVIRKIKGNREILLNELAIICGHRPISMPRSIVIKGNYKNKIKQYLKGIGF